MSTFDGISKYIQAFFCAAVLVGLAGCGGGGGGGGSKSSGSAAPITASGRVVEIDSRPIPGASAIMPYGDNKVWGGVSDANGNLNFQVRASDFKGIDPVVMIVSKDGYRPKTLFLPPVSSARNIDISTVVLEGLAADEFVPRQSVGLWHLGDGKHSGSANSMFQVAAFGTSIAFEVTDWDQAKSDNYKRMTVAFVGRGVETAGGVTSINCRAGYDNRVSAFAVLNNVAHGESNQAPGNSDASGNFTSYQLILNAEDFQVGSKVFVGFTSGACLDPAVSDFDDFEITEIVVTFSS